MNTKLTANHTYVNMTTCRSPTAGRLFHLAEILSGQKANFVEQQICHAVLSLDEPVHRRQVHLQLQHFSIRNVSGHDITGQGLQFMLMGTVATDFLESSADRTNQILDCSCSS